MILGLRLFNKRLHLQQGINMKASISIILLFLSTMTFADTSSDIEKVILDNLKYTQNENVDAVMGDMHSQSPAYLSTQQVLQQLFPAYDLKYELLKYTLVGVDSDYAYARIKQSTKKVSGPAFQDNEIEMLTVFKKENGKWKFWTQANLSITFI